MGDLHPLPLITHLTYRRHREGDERRQRLSRQTHVGFSVLRFGFLLCPSPLASSVRSGPSAGGKIERRRADGRDPSIVEHHSKVKEGRRHYEDKSGR